MFGHKTAERNKIIEDSECSFYPSTSYGPDEPNEQQISHISQLADKQKGVVIQKL